MYVMTLVLLLEGGTGICLVIEAFVNLFIDILAGGTNFQLDCL